MSSSAISTSGSGFDRDFVWYRDAFGAVRHWGPGVFQPRPPLSTDSRFERFYKRHRPLRCPSRSSRPLGAPWRQMIGRRQELARGFPVRPVGRTPTSDPDSGHRDVGSIRCLPGCGCGSGCASSTEDISRRRSAMARSKTPSPAARVRAGVRFAALQTSLRPETIWLRHWRAAQ